MICGYRFLLLWFVLLTIYSCRSSMPSYGLEISSASGFVIAKQNIKSARTLSFRVPSNLYIYAKPLGGNHDPLRVYTYNGGYIYLAYTTFSSSDSVNLIKEHSIDLTVDQFELGLGGSDTLELRVNNLICKEYIQGDLIIGYVLARDYEESIFDSVIFNPVIEVLEN